MGPECWESCYSRMKTTRSEAKARLEGQTEGGGESAWVAVSPLQAGASASGHAATRAPPRPGKGRRRGRTFASRSPTAPGAWGVLPPASPRVLATGASLLTRRKATTLDRL